MANAGDFQKFGNVVSVFEFFKDYFARIVGSVGITYWKTVTISAGSSLSNPVDISGFRNIAITMPDDWTTANLTFMVGPRDGSPDQFANLYDSAGNEVVLTAAEDRTITDIPELAPCRWIRIRSGTNASSINQTADRELVLILKG